MNNNLHIGWVGLLLAALLSSCSPRTLREAQTVVSQADSLWSAGQMCSDSVSLAQAYETLDQWQWISPDAYVHACYHYGKLLREKEDPVSAMQAFINATHTRSHDYQILARVYSNMGSMCHLACEFPLSYDMYERSANLFLENGDTLLYYYGLNNMAYELAEQGKKDETLNLLSRIETECADSLIVQNVLITKAEAYLRSQGYDSTLYYAYKVLAKQNWLISKLQLAQAYSFLGFKDSATYYATQILESTQDLFALNNALYILTNDDESKDKIGIREIASDRSDTQKQIEIERSRLSQAVQLLEQDLRRKPNLLWMYSAIAAFLIAGGVFYWRFRVRRQQMRADVDQLVERQVETIVQSIKQHIDKNDLAHTLHWKDYSAMKADADLYMGGIVRKLEDKYLNETEIRFCVLTMLEFPLSQIAETIHYSYPSGIKTLKKRTSTKLGTTPPNLHDFLLALAAKL